MDNNRHKKYMFEFRTLQCEQFIEHKCSFHKPYNCFDWHFPNQRRRVPGQLQNGTFNYNPDLYCNSYDQNTGLCDREPGCQYVHMNVGDTERRYHPRYYKTGMCIYETSADGVCGKNGVHCAFAHDVCDMRRPLLDIRETLTTATNLSAQLEKERVLAEDPIWNEMDYVLAFYKTEECRKLPKTCRQGYACPFYHNSKDRRRRIQDVAYQSQPCALLKPANDEWQDVIFCLDQDTCKFSHSRTEQQFHPEIFKSSKCNDILRDNYCPRGPFCAFCHTDAELNTGQYQGMLQFAVCKYTSLNQLAALIPSVSGGLPIASSSKDSPGSNTSTGSGFDPTGLKSAAISINNNMCLPTAAFTSASFDHLSSHSANVFQVSPYLSSPLSGQHSHKSSERSSPASCPGRESSYLLRPHYHQQQQNLQRSPRDRSPQPVAAIAIDSEPIVMDDMPTPTMAAPSNIKAILERALSNSSNVNKMSEREIHVLLAQYSQDQKRASLPEVKDDNEGENDENEGDKDDSGPEMIPRADSAARDDDELDNMIASNWRSTNNDSSQQTETMTANVGSSNLSENVGQMEDELQQCKIAKQEMEDELLKVTAELKSEKASSQSTVSGLQSLLKWLTNCDIDDRHRNDIAEKILQIISSPEEVGASTCGFCYSCVGSRWICPVKSTPSPWGLPLSFKPCMCVQSTPPGERRVPPYNLFMLLGILWPISKVIKEDLGISY